ncbi:hypothetical protein N7509_010025 [Penicillium cosmopolitanum]|uniref:Uncharacterized protein n=1 Tax=Penicillium cosmopolitanum TaxID=1131564 RepID=A0A9X0B460_9EURO|nr:uncharacterized protein N7509_010025 [Penicillium cosmopolitanum]KAJ5387484.1 hypothetical protein N7509_010025 [Penicillium cosmopolitanum]
MTWKFPPIYKKMDIRKYCGYNIIDSIKTNFQNAYERNKACEGIELIYGRACFVKPKIIKVQQETSNVTYITAPSILIIISKHPKIP